MADKKLIIADGHHRYETSVAYAKERSAQLRLPLGEPRDPDEKLGTGRLPAPPFPEAAMMMTFVNMDAPGITILPTHRVVFGLKEFKRRGVSGQGAGVLHGDAAGFGGPGAADRDRRARRFWW